MFGTFGMAADVQPTIGGLSSGLLYPGRTDKYTDVAVDAQYQYIDELNVVSVRGYYLWENQKLDATFFGSLAQGTPAASRTSEDLQSLNISASYIYDRHISFSAGYAQIQGTYDPLYWSFSTVGKPNSEYLTFDLAYMPFPYGGPDFWPWLNARIGVTYTHYLKFDGSVTNVDAGSNAPYIRSASDYDTTFLYAWIDF